MPRLADFPPLPTHCKTACPQIPFDFHDLVAAIAPRPCLIAAPIHDANFKWDSVDRVAAAAARIYALYNASTIFCVPSFSASLVS